MAKELLTEHKASGKLERKQLAACRQKTVNGRSKMKKCLTLFCFLSVTLSSVFLPVVSRQYPAETQLGLPEGAIARLGKGEINEVQYPPDGSQLAVASSIGIWLYDAESGEPHDLLTAHTDDVRSVAFSPDGSTLASASSDKTVRL